jgi:hypothetical protein
MKDIYYIDLSLGYLCVCFGILLFLKLITSILDNNFYTLHVFVRKFSLIDLESPATPLELATYINGIYALPEELGERSLKSLKFSLYFEFIVMLFLYGTIFLLCMQLSMKFHITGRIFFQMLGWLQILEWILDIVEHVYLLKKIHPKTIPSSRNVHSMMQISTVCKYVIYLGTVVICLSIMVYFWLTGNYAYISLHYFTIIALEIIAFIILKKITAKDPKIILDKYSNVVN